MAETAIDAGKKIFENVDRLAGLIVQAQYQAEPIWNSKYGAAGYSKSLQDVRYHLLVLGQTLVAEDQRMLLDYMEWARIVLHTRGISGEHLDSCMLRYAPPIFLSELAPEHAEIAVNYTESARTKLADELVLPPSHLPEAGALQGLAETYLNALLYNNGNDARNALLGALSQGISAEQLYLQIVGPTQREIGRLWQINKITVAQEHYCTSQTQRLLSELASKLSQNKSESGVAVVACIGGELHDMGSRIVADFLQACGWVTYHLGQSTPALALVEMVKMTGAALLALSCTIAYHISIVAETISAIRQNPATADLRIIVGGRAFENAPALPQRLGADGYARDAAGACALAASLV